MAGSLNVEKQDDYNDLYLAEKVRMGDNEAFKALSKKYSLLIRSIARKYSAYGYDQNDFIQEGLLGLLCACKFFSAEKNTSFRTFVSLCINRRFLSLVRKDRSQKVIPSENIVPIEDLELSDNNTLNPENLILQKERFEDFDKLLKDRLSSLELRVLSLYLAGMSYSDIANKLSVTPKSVDNALVRIRRKISKT